MINRFIPILALALACGGEAEELGQVAQALSVPNEYGNESPSQGRCIAPWTACYIPATKAQRIRFFDVNCSAWWKARINYAIDYFIVGVPSAWVTTKVTSGAYEISIECGDLPGTLGGQYAVGQWFTEGSYRKVQNGFVTIDTAALAADMTNLSETEKQRYGNNAVKHELGHAFGLGHDSVCGGVSCGFMAPSSIYRSQGQMEFTNFQYDRLNAYQL